MTDETPTRVRAWWEAIRAKLRQRGWIAALLVPVLLYVLNAFAAETTVKVARVVGTFLGEFLRPIISTPVGIAGLLFFALLSVLVLRAYLETRRQIQATAAIGLLEEQLKQGQVREETAQATIKEQAKALTQSEARHRALFQRLTYGAPLIEPAPLDAANFAVMFTRVEEMLPNLGAMAKDANTVWQHFVAQIASQGKDSGLVLLAQQVNDQAIAPTMSAIRLLQDLVWLKQDPRPGLAIFYQRYSDWRAWILRYIEMLRSHLYTAPGAVGWQLHDAQFFKDLQQRFSSSLFAEVRDAARAYTDEHGLQHPLPGPP
jgi:hypothetical protein